MKKIFFFIVFTFIALFFNAQTYMPLPMDTACWRTTYSYVTSNNCGCSFDYLLKTNGDTLINSIIYTKISRSGPTTCYCGGPQHFPITGAIRQDTLSKKVYIVKANTTTEKILYDFTQTTGDTLKSELTQGCGGPYIISGVDSVLLSNGYHRRIKLQSNGCIPSFPVSFIEGVGSTNGLLEPLFNFEFGGTLQCMVYKNQSIYSVSTGSCSNLITNIKSEPLKKIEFSVYPNPVTNGIFEIRFDTFINDGYITIYDLLTKQIEFQKINNSNKIQIHNTSLSKGIYLLKITGNDQLLMHKLIVD